MPKLIRLSEFDAQHYVNTERYAVEVNKLFNIASLEFSVLASKLSVDPGKPFSFKDYPRTAAKAKEIAVKLNEGTVNLIQHGVEKQWLSSCKKNDAFIASILDTTKLPKKRLVLMQDKNLEALKQFQDQKVGGLGLSERVWKTTSRFQKQIEVGLDTGIGDGRGAIEIASKLKQNLQYPDKLFHRVRDKHGALVASSAMKAFHPGRGVYKSSAKNAQRLTRTVINMGYRESDWLRWQSLDFVVGFEVKRTQRENKCSCPVCEALQGKYPKWFKWVGWHPQCMCYAVPILAAIEDMSNQMLADLRAALYGSEYGKLVAKNTVLDVPQAFKDWAHQNIDKSQGWKSVPYFVRDNFVDGSLLKGLNYPSAFKPKRSFAEAKIIRDKWEARRKFRASTVKVAKSIIKAVKTGYEIDTTEIKKLLEQKRYKALRAETSVVAKKIEGVKKQLKTYSGLLVNVQGAVEQHGLASTKKIYDAVSAKLAMWEHAELSTLIKKLKFEIDWVEDKKAYSTWKEAQDAYKKQLQEAENKQGLLVLQKGISSIEEYLKTSKSSILKKQYEDLLILKKAGNLEGVKSLIEKADKKIASLESRKTKKVSFPKSAYTKARKNAAFWETHSAKGADEAFRSTSGRAWRSSNEEERVAAYRYTAGSSYINEPLRGIPYSGQYLGKYNSEEDARRLSRIIARSRYKFDIWVQRGVSYEGVSKLLGVNLKEISLSELKGRTVTEAAFSSCSAMKGKGFADNVAVYNIYCPKGTQMLYAEPFSQYGGGAKSPKWDGIGSQSNFESEMEIILQKNTTFRVIKAEQKEGKWYIDLEVISQ